MAQQMISTKTTLVTTDDGQEVNRQQFQRTVFDSVVDITVDDNLLIQIFKSKTSVTEMMSRIAIKCPNIERLDCRGMKTFNAFIPEVLQSLRDNCHHLREIWCHLTSKSDQWIQEFGPLVTLIEGVSVSERHSLIHCNQLSEMMVKSVSDICSASGQPLVRNIRHLELIYNGVEDNQLFTQLVAENQSLTSLYVNAMTPESVEMLTEVLDSLTRLSCLPQLRELMLTMADISSLFADSMLTIGHNCRHLTSITLFMPNINEQNVHHLSELSLNPRLKSLKIALNLFGNAVKDFVSESFRPLRDCRRLTHLSIYCYQINAQLLANFLEDKPRLLYLAISGLKTNAELNQCLPHIASLPALQTLVVHNPLSTDSNNYIIELYVKQLIPKLKNIEFYQN